MGGVLGGFSSPKIFWGDRNIFFLNPGRASIEKLLAIQEKGGFTSIYRIGHLVAGTPPCLMVSKVPSAPSTRIGVGKSG